MTRGLLGVGVVVVILLAAMQAVPYGRDHANPPVRGEPRWDSQETRSLAVRVCFDCHSNQTVWPWYSNVAPVSCLTQRDVDEGRKVLNFSEWNRPQEEAHEAGETVREGEMPPWFYLVTRPHARLTRPEKAGLARGLDATLGAERRAKKKSRD